MLNLSSQPQSVAALWPVLGYTFWWQAHGVNNLWTLPIDLLLDSDPSNPRLLDLRCLLQRTEKTQLVCTHATLNAKSSKRRQTYLHHPHLFIYYNIFQNVATHNYIPVSQHSTRISVQRAYNRSCCKATEKPRRDINITRSPCCCWESRSYCVRRILINHNLYDNTLP